MSYPFTRSAADYVAAIRQHAPTDGQPDWFTVAAAYDAGLVHGTERKEHARDQLVKLREQARSVTR